MVALSSISSAIPLLFPPTVSVVIEGIHEHATGVKQVSYKFPCSFSPVARALSIFTSRGAILPSMMFVRCSCSDRWDLYDYASASLPFFCFCPEHLIVSDCLVPL